MARKMRRFADGGNARYDRKVKDIESDYQKALKMGREVGVAKAKYEQRMADAKDDLAKWTKADRTQTRAAEQAAERNLSEARRTKGESVRRSDAFGAKLAEKAPDLRGNIGKVEAVKTSAEPSALTFAQKFRMERDRQGAGKTFTWQGKSYSTNMAGEGASKPKATSTTSAPTKREAPAAKRETPVSTKREASVDMSGVKRGIEEMTRTAGALRPRASATPAQPSYVDKLERSAAEKRKLEGSSAGLNVGAKLAGKLGFGASADERLARNLRDSATRQSAVQASIAKRNAEAEAEDRARAAQRNREGRAKALAGNPFYKSYLDKDEGMKKGGKVKKYAKGGKIDGCAVRGMTRAKRSR